MNNANKKTSSIETLTGFIFRFFILKNRTAEEAQITTVIEIYFDTIKKLEKKFMKTKETSPTHRYNKSNGCVVDLNSSLKKISIRE
jgi:hypothetical protein